MTIGKPELVMTNPKHMTGFSPAEAGKPGGNFADVMLRALDKVSADQRLAGNLIQTAISDPGAVDAHDITIAQAKAAMSLNISRTILNRVVQGWKDIINTR
jgi:flagellar hook-basal body complex protein FliE